MENPSKNGCRTEPVSARVAELVSGRFWDGFGRPKRSQKRSGTGRFGTSKKKGVADACNPKARGETQRAAEVWDYVIGSASD